MKISLLLLVVLVTFVVAQLPDGFKSCGTAQDNFTLQKLIVNPLNPVIGKEVQITAHGNVNFEDIVEGATVKVVAKVGNIITVLDKVFNLCEQAATANITCPIKVGPNEFGVKLLVPSNTPSIKVTVKATITNANGNAVGCFTGPLQIVKS
ncbi:Phosphatidylglycerol/phosphatidylinositol transfer protein [Clydaea vesicula]|uniref:Phosphatidylglycerol/phosphatidylinositol transfer protein n=1 Tax=Clydaea vesicula TaxID=447962 RepID=A0AAD5U5J0_9FUNG|nr:Phosphatidylglycerol/phosphatidylinositol transfer protein [Clydaea vesicula]KAJ3388352.1 Phosphatidylglycerol/phosphatidylinositol transfer protein [Lobulomyces angularis]